MVRPTYVSNVPLLICLTFHWYDTLFLTFSIHNTFIQGVIWYKPPFCKTVETNPGKEFFKILKTCFPPSNSLHKFFNRNSVKLSYSCMPSIVKIVLGLNMKIKKEYEVTPLVIAPCMKVFWMENVKKRVSYINVKSSKLIMEHRKHM